MTQLSQLLQTTAIKNKCSAVAETDDRLSTIDMGQKWGAMPPFSGGAGSPSNTMWPYQVAA